MDKTKTQGKKALDSALDRYVDMRSGPGRKIRKVLRELQTNRQAVIRAIENRAAQRKRDAASYTKQALEAAQKMHNLRAKELEQLKKLGSRELEQIAGSLLEASRIHLESVQGSCKVMSSAIELQSTLDDQVFGWLDNLIVDAVATLYDDSAVDRVVASLSAATIAGGFSGPVAAVAAAVAAAALLIADTYKRFSKKAKAKSADLAALKLEQAEIVISTVSDLTKKCANILK